MSNFSEIQDGNDEEDERESDVTVVIFTLLGLLIITGNALSIPVFWKRRFSFKRTTIFLLNLTFADLMVGFVVLGQIALSFLSNEQEAPILIVLTPFDSFTGLSSIFFLAAISLERAYAIAFPLRHVSTSTRYYVITVCVVWSLAGLLSGLILLSLFGILAKKAAFVVIPIFVGLALLVTCGSYTSIWIKMRKRIFNLPSNRELRIEQNRRLAKTLFLLTLLSLMAWLPFYVIFTIFQFFPEVMIPEVVILIARNLQYMNSLINPVVYNLRNREFRKTWTSLVCCCLVRDKAPTMRDSP